MANFGSQYRYKRDYLIRQGLLEFEAREIARNYDMPQIRSLPYIQAILKSRRLTISNYRKRGLRDSQIREKIIALYKRRGWLTPEGKPDVWAMIRYYRKEAIDANEYNPTKRKGSHHKVGSGISKGDIEGQRKRRKSKTKAQQREDLNQEIVRAIVSGDQELRKKLEAKRNRIYGY